jgi:hypothetical protein
VANQVKSKPQGKAATMLYLYGISAPGQKMKVSSAIDGASQVQSIENSELQAWFSRVSGEEFGENLAKNMENLEWLAAASVRHQRVVSEISAEITLLPARFGTVFASETSLFEHLKAQKSTLLATLKRIEGSEEWGVKLFLNSPPAAAQIKAASGRDYLRAKAAAVESRKRRELDPEVVEFARELQAIAADSAPAGKVSSGQNRLEWQASFLLRKKDRPKWDKTMKKYATRWADRREIECTGPWPPYSFV